MKTVIVDIDGTLADCEHRRHFLNKRPVDWNSFFGAMDNDPLIEPVAEILDALDNGDWNVILCSGRPDSYREVTVQWLMDHFIPYNELHMRAAGDHRSDVIVKREMLQSFRARDLDIRFVIDDRKSVVDMWRDEGLICLQAAPGFDEKQKYDSGTLHILVGPSGAGKSSYACDFLDFQYLQDGIISSDKIREDLCGDFKDQSKNDQVFAALHAIVKARIEHGLDTVVDATNIRNRDRRALRDLCDSSTKIVYHVIDRPLDEKIRDGGWRNEVMIGEQTLVERHHEIFQSNLTDILAGDNDDRVEVRDLRR